MRLMMFYLLWCSAGCIVSSSLQNVNIQNLANFINDYVETSEYQFPYYTVIICSTSGHELVKALSAPQSKFYLMRTASQNNVSEWKVTPDPQGFILDIHCPDTRRILAQASELVLLRRPYSWLVISEAEMVKVSPTSRKFGIEGQGTSQQDESKNNQFEWLNKLNLRVDSLLVMANAISADHMLLTEYYKIRPKMELKSNKLGEWSALNGMELAKMDVMAWRRRNLQATVISATIVINHDESLQHLEDMVDKHHDSASRLSYAMITSMAATFNASISLVKTDTWGTFQNGEWNGMVADLVGNKAEVGSCPLFLTPQRMQVVDYLQGTSQARTAFIATAPPLSYSSNLFALPFSGPVWICSVALIVITSLLLYITAKVENKPTVVEKDTLGASWSDIAMLNMGAICQQGCDAEPKGPSGRIVTLILYLAVMFLYVSYSASIVALLQSSDTSIRTIRDLLESPLQCGAENIPYQRAWFKAAADPRGDPVRRDFYLKKIAPKGEENANFLTIEEGIRKVRQGLYAFHVEVSPGYQVVQQTFTESEKCGLQELPSFIQVPEPWIPMQKNSPFSEMFKIGIKIAREVGIESRSTGRIYTKKPPCSAPGSNFVSVGVMDVYRLFLILTYGVVSSLVLAVIEKLAVIRLKRRLQEGHFTRTNIAEDREIDGGNENTITLS